MSRGVIVVVRREGRGTSERMCEVKSSWTDTQLVDEGLGCEGKEGERGLGSLRKQKSHRFRKGRLYRRVGWVDGYESEHGEIYEKT